MEQDSHLTLTVSATTRAPRPGEKEGQDYYFLARDEFERRIAAGEFAEWAEVHGNLYGTLGSELDRHTALGEDVVLELDVQGMRSLKAMMPDAVTTFIMAPSLEELENRLRRRGTNDDEDIGLRLENARAEMAARSEYDYIVVNDTLAEAVADMAAVVRAERCRADRQL
jgi:guanylate kinase